MKTSLLKDLEKSRGEPFLFHRVATLEAKDGSPASGHLVGFKNVLIYLPEDVTDRSGFIMWDKQTLNRIRYFEDIDGYSIAIETPEGLVELHGFGSKEAALGMREMLGPQRVPLAPPPEVTEPGPPPPELPGRVPRRPASAFLVLFLGLFVSGLIVWLLAGKKTEEARQDSINVRRTVETHDSDKLLDDDFMKELFPELYENQPKEKNTATKKAETLYKEGNRLIHKRDFIGAIWKFMEALNVNPDFTKAHRGLGICYAQIRQNRKACRHYRIYKDSLPSDSKEIPALRQILENCPPAE